MRVTTRKTIRDLRRQRAQATAVGITVMLGVALFIASGGAFGNLSDSYRKTYDRLHFADVTASGSDIAGLASAARSAGAVAVTTRTQADLPMLIAGTKLAGRVVGLPDVGQPAVDGVDVTAGSYLSPDQPDGVLVERHAAATFGLRVGDTIGVFGPDGWHTATVRGIAGSAEYIWPARSRQEVLSDPHAFAVVFAPEQTAQRWAGSGPNQVMAVVARTAAPQSSATALAERLRQAGAVDVTVQKDQASQASLQEDLNGFAELAILFPLLFLTAAAVAAYVLLARRVLAERPIIGALMASGARRSRLVRHYLQQGAFVGVAGAAVGVVLGVVATSALTRAYTSSLGIPDTVVTQHPALIVIGVTFGAVVGLTGAAAPAVLAARTVPAAAMRNQTVSRAPGWWSRAISRVRVVPVTWRMALRDVVRNLRRTGATMLGTVLSLILILAAGGMLTSFTDALAVQFDQIERQDATVAVQNFGFPTDPLDALAHTPGVTSVEPAVMTQVTASHGTATYTTQLTGLLPGTTMHRFRATSGHWITLPADGVLAGAALADKLNIHVGDPITLTAPDGTSTQIPLAGLLNEPLGTSLYATTTTAAAVSTRNGISYYLLRFAPGVGHDTMRRAITAQPAVISYADAAAVTTSVDKYLGLVWAFIGIMIVLGAILAFAVIYVTMAVNVAERTNELATLRAAGVGLRRLAGMIATENLVATALGVPVGLVLGVLAAGGFLDSFNNDLFHVELSLAWWILPAAALGVLLAASLSQWPAVRAIRRMDIARVVRERAQ